MRWQVGSRHESGKHNGHGSHGWMIACCVPILAATIVLVATGVAGTGFLIIAVMCAAMMAAMMGGLSRNSSKF